MAPIMPHITEAVYHLYFKQHEQTSSVHKTSWPEFDESKCDEYAEKAGDLLVDVITAVRRIKSDSDISLGKEVQKVIIECTGKEQDMLEEAIIDIKNATRAEAVEFGAVKGQESVMKCPNSDMNVAIVF